MPNIVSQVCMNKIQPNLNLNVLNFGCNKITRFLLALTTLLLVIDLVKSQDCTNTNIFPLLYGDGTGHMKLRAFDTNSGSSDIILGLETKYDNPTRTEGTIVRINKDGKVLWSKIINRRIGIYHTRILDVIEGDTTLVFLEAFNDKSNPLIVKFDTTGNLLSAFGYGSTNFNSAWNPKKILVQPDGSYLITYNAQSATNGVSFSATSGIDTGIFKALDTTISWNLAIDYALTNNPPTSISQSSTHCFLTSSLPTGILLSKLALTTGLVSGSLPASAFYPTAPHASLHAHVTDSFGITCYLLPSVKKINCFKFSLETLAFQESFSTSSTETVTEVASVIIGEIAFFSATGNSGKGWVFAVDLATGRFGTKGKESVLERGLTNGLVRGYGAEVLFAGDMTGGQDAGFSQSQVALF